MSLIYFILAISLLVTLHEFGHFWVARRLGVKVIRFSVGFGKPILRFKDKNDIEYAIAPIPLGGYVKMLDEREAPVADELKGQAHNNKPPLARMAIAAAGPIANFLFAIVAYWFLLTGTQQEVIPVVATLKQNSPAYLAGVRAGDEIVSVDDKPVTNWQMVSWQLIERVGETGEMTLGVLTQEGQLKQHKVVLKNWLSSDNIEPLKSLGVTPRRLVIPAVIDQVQIDGAASQAGLISGDKILKVDATEINDWYQWVGVIQQSASKRLELQIKRRDQIMTLFLSPQSKITDGKQIGFIGASVKVPEYPKSWIRSKEIGLFEGLILGIEKTWRTSLFTLESLGKMITGTVSIKNLSGPISIAKVAGDTAAVGFTTFVSFLALLSVSLGVLNLLPVPVLDGGHIVFALYEFVAGKPMPEFIQSAALKIGVVLLFSMMFLAFYNDIYRLIDK